MKPGTYPAYRQRQYRIYRGRRLIALREVYWVPDYGEVSSISSSALATLTMTRQPALWCRRPRPMQLAASVRLPMTLKCGTTRLTSSYPPTCGRIPTSRPAALSPAAAESRRASS
jgi:hypothetical protein